MPGGATAALAALPSLPPRVSLPPELASRFGQAMMGAAGTTLASKDLSHGDPGQSVAPVFVKIVQILWWGRGEVKVTKAIARPAPPPPHRPRPRPDAAAARARIDLHPRACARAALSLALLGLLGLRSPVTADDGGGWRVGRATFYGWTDGMSVDSGSCMYGALPNAMVSTGTNVVALSDQNDGYSGSCGRCYEVKCNPTDLTDGYGNKLPRTKGCNGATVVVTVTDSW
ncbi:Expansin-A8 [Tetrabaena socialis]|uniref:Expansin-A8 n=1 Tax=Tetrabaena socialis TaxID=47790 RepID=A0A2J7ZU49_9CHLO|nr:Expansin-A8 [Tetrabaena socialis]|eukprot:PNH03760.1 Expansin-A8 [Tetrabaena socialis]